MQRVLGRIEFDAYRTDLDTLQLAPGGAGGGGAPAGGVSGARLEDAQRKYAAHKDKYDKLRADVAIKLKFLEENKVSELCSPASAKRSIQDFILFRPARERTSDWFFTLHTLIRFIRVCDELTEKRVPSVSAIPVFAHAFN